MTDRAAAMTGAKRALNREKYERVRAVIVQIKDQGREDRAQGDDHRPPCGSSPLVREQPLRRGRSGTPRRRSSRDLSPG